MICSSSLGHWCSDALCGNESMKIGIEKIFVIVFFVCLCISALTFLAYDHVGEEIKNYIIWINILFLLIIIAMMIYAKIFLIK